jgi:hypothetical protein
MESLQARDWDTFVDIPPQRFEAALEMVMICNDAHQVAHQINQKCWTVWPSGVDIRAIHRSSTDPIRSHTDSAARWASVGPRKGPVCLGCQRWFDALFAGPCGKMADVAWSWPSEKMRCTKSHKKKKKTKQLKEFSILGGNWFVYMFFRQVPKGKAL